MNGLKGKNVLVTGGTSGIGQAIAVRFAREESNVAINSPGSMEDAEKTHNLTGCWRSTCGVPTFAPEKPSSNFWRPESPVSSSIFPVSIKKSPSRALLGIRSGKGGMQNLTRTLALEYGGRGIRVNAIGPGATVTPINRSWIDNPEKRAMVEAYIPLGRAGTSQEMAAMTAFLASDEAAYITGQTLFVDGGLTLHPDFRTAWSSE
jgi:NAD(P)-dependent dehydrogenase (short-subunit alcohol dehydrogenase family)